MSVQVIVKTNTAKPYKGPESYQVEDADLFFGRDLEAEQLIAKILSSRFTLLHAQSGAGKTSLLNARIIPGLEARGWDTCRILPQNDPIESIRATTLQYLLPHPEAERFSVERAWRALARDGDDLTLDELLNRYDGLKIRDGRRRALVAPVELHLLEATSSSGPGAIDTYFCRLLRSCVEMEVLAEHLAAVQQGDHMYHPPRAAIGGATKASELIAMLAEKQFSSAYNRLLNELKVPGRDLLVFFKHIIETYGRRRTRFAIALILDQFEELFTRFVDPGVTASECIGELPDWRLRWELFEQLEQLHEAHVTEPATGEKGGEVKQPLPLRCVVSMRDEYIAQMDPLRRLSRSLSEGSYHLKLLEKEQAKTAIEEPAAIFGYTYEPSCFDRIIGQLTKEDRFVEPAHLQLVCEKLWTEKGRELASINAEGRGVGRFPMIRREVLQSLGETRGILKSFFKDFLGELDNNERLEVLEMLEPLVTASGTRNIMERDRIVNAPFRDRSRRQALLNKLVNHTIVRTEQRLGGYFVEITHEFLIGPILEAIRDALSNDPEYSRYRLALRTLERLQGTSIAGTERLLTPSEFLILHAHRETIHWDGWSAQLMLRMALALDVSSEVLSHWVNTFEIYGKPVTLSDVLNLDEGAARGEERELLSLAEMRLVNAEDCETLKLSARQTRLIFRSELFWAVDDEREEISVWTERMKSYDK
jgi:hypothetical protein